MGKTAIILGASGLTGSILLKKLLEDKRYDSVKIFSRNPTGTDHPKLLEFTGNLLELESFKKDFVADEVYCCIGTTAKKTPDKELYKKIDYGIPVAAARLSKKYQIGTFLVISSLGADKKSRIFYNRTKGEMEKAVLEQKIEHTYILRPSIILGKRNETRTGENMGKIFMKLFQFLLIGKLKKYKPIEAGKIASAMIILANSLPDFTIVESDRISKLSA